MCKKIAEHASSVSHNGKIHRYIADLKFRITYYDEGKFGVECVNQKDIFSHSPSVSIVLEWSCLAPDFEFILHDCAEVDFEYMALYITDEHFIVVFNLKFCRSK